MELHGIKFICARNCFQVKLPCIRTLNQFFKDLFSRWREVGVGEGKVKTIAPLWLLFHKFFLCYLSKYGFNKIGLEIPVGNLGNPIMCDDNASEE